ncbi:scarecrow-like protein 3 [Cinnamomum micranthum f. kanehirae]|uniref:Scarecrow-like protein 3 n=1 Tax=Cinnamomum micranthum f. kanehirae TaxID=337451 RepID=A0A443NF65_9MAGN|nr:scarecrow-like protein 3 [Cinnamomum micranthum f. kanehirae]
MVTSQYQTKTQQLEMESSPRPKKPLSLLNLTLSPNTSSKPPPQTSKPEDQGLRLIQLLLTCAAHVSSGNLNRADACLQQISHLSSVSGDSMQRLAAHFASSLATRLLKGWPGVYTALNQTRLCSKPEPDPTRTARLAFSRSLPYVGFAHAIIHRTIVHAMTEERVVHILDLGSGDPALWGPILRAFSRRSPHGPPYLKITSVHASKDVLDYLGSNLVKEAEALDIPFQFNPLNLSLKDLTLDQLKVRSGEALAVCSMLALHALLAEEACLNPCKQMDVFLAMVRSMSPKLFVLVEQESDHNSTRLVDRFVQGLYHYSALFDSIEAAAGSLSGRERMAVEDMLGAEIENIVACEGVERVERHERANRWMVRFGRAGFRPVRLWGVAVEEVMHLVESYGRDGFKVVSERMFEMICWHERALYSVSAWHC